MKYIYLILLCIINVLITEAQEIKFLDAQKPAMANIEQMNWLCGHWKGSIASANIEEIWVEPQGHQMMGIFRMYNEEIELYEFMSISENDGSLTLKIKHFDKNLIAKEEKEQYEEFKLVHIEENMAYFDAFTFQVSNDTLSIHLYFDRNGERKNKGLFKYQRITK